MKKQTAKTAMVITAFIAYLAMVNFVVLPAWSKWGTPETPQYVAAYTFYLILFGMIVAGGFSLINRLYKGRRI